MRLLRRRRRKQKENELVYANGKSPRFDPDGEGGQMGLFEHLGELRRRITWVFVALILGTVVGFIAAGPALDFMRGPYCQVTADEIPLLDDEGVPMLDADGNPLLGNIDDCELVILGPTEGIVQYFKVALMIGGVLAIPVTTYQVMMFVLPGLKRGERRSVLLAIPAITFLFIVGSVFAWEVLMPPALGFLEGFQPTLFRPEWTASLYISFVISLVFWMGVAFETPLVFFVLSLFGVVSAGALARNWRVAVVGSAIAAAFITPTIDPVNMALVMGPLMVLYLFSILLVMIGRRIGGFR